MKEKVGVCIDCGNTVFCLAGFLNGVVLKEGRLRCFDCDREAEKKDESR
ncbi:MAG: hypothetical protein M0Z65_12525 [Firmicutes bacterium]|uniref:Uncharacterized protein n=1 Tax=Melghirimyces thermohalophilus TaxID=1236220 RepID=A0A1G6QLE0_9BACL|nr:hypothetical protein [Melghirimyces thermohalophilus]MDA8353972.1 hypothetical protein [Bacillota bacterium]SDC93021.1 hypothetical protein SAMN04488112_12240 [Melghirimyces thermohalophilus]